MSAYETKLSGAELKAKKELVIGAIEKRIQKFVDKCNLEKRTRYAEGSVGYEDMKANLVDQLYADGAKRIARHCLPILEKEGLVFNYGQQDNYVQQDNYIIRIAPASLNEMSNQVEDNPLEFGLHTVRSLSRNTQSVYGYSMQRLAKDFGVAYNSLSTMTATMRQALTRTTRKRISRGMYETRSIVTKKWIYGEK